MAKEEAINPLCNPGHDIPLDCSRGDLQLDKAVFSVISVLGRASRVSNR